MFSTLIQRGQCRLWDGAGDKHRLWDYQIQFYPGPGTETFVWLWPHRLSESQLPHLWNGSTVLLEKQFSRSEPVHWKCLACSKHITNYIPCILISTFIDHISRVSWMVQRRNISKSLQALFSWAPKSLQTVTAAMKWKDACSLGESYDKPRQHIKKQRHHFTYKGLSSQSYGFWSSHVWMWELDYKESWVPKNWCFWTVVLEKTLESPLDCKEIKSVNPKGNQSWIFIRRTDAEAAAPILWPPEAKSWLIRKDWGQEEKGVIEDELVGWHHWLHEPECKQTLGNNEGQGGLVCCSPWGHKNSTWLSDWTTITTCF